MSKITIEPAKADSDFEAVKQIYYQTWLDTYRGQVPDELLASLTPETWHPEKRWQGTQLARLADGTIVGVCSYGAARLSAFAGDGEVYSVYVLPQFQHSGIGGQLMSAALKALRQDYHQVYLDVLVSNDSARKFYEQIGFKNSGEVRHDNVPGGELVTVVYLMQLGD